VAPHDRHDPGLEMGRQRDVRSIDGCQQAARFFRFGAERGRQLARGPFAVQHLLDEWIELPVHRIS
jgi:hypothetical protein